MNLATLLSKRDAIAILELIHSISLSGEDSQIHDAFERMKTLINYTYAGCGLFQQGPSGEPQSLKLMNFSYPEDWVQLYSLKEWHKIDPLQIDTFKRFNLQYWADIFKRYDPPREMKYVADDFGIRDGYVHGVKGLNGDRASTFFLSGETVRREIRTEAILRLIIPHLHQALLRISRSDQRRAPLSQREREVLKWCSKGKTNWEISMILKISERTVAFHIANAMQKLNASTRTHAVAIALDLGVVELG